MSEQKPETQPNADVVHDLLRSAPFGILAADSTGRITASNEAAAALVGRTPTSLTGTHLVDLLADPGESPLLDDTVRTALGGVQVRRTFQISANGVLRSIDLQCWSERGGSNDPVVLAMLEPAGADDQVRQLQALIARSASGMAQLAPDLTIVDINGRWAEITGQSTAEAMGLGWLSCVDEDGRAEFIDSLAKSLHAREGIRGRLRIVTPSGQFRWLEISTTPLDAPAGALLSFEDTTEDQDAARRADELSRVLEATKDLVGILSADGATLVWLNDTFGRFLPAEAMSTPFVRHLDQYSQATFVATALPAVHSTGSWRGELNVIRADGSVAPMSTMFVAHLDDAGNAEAISMVARDVTDLRDAQALVAASETRMAAMVEHASDLVVLIDDKGTVMYASPAVERVLGHPPGSLDGVDVLELVHPEDLQIAYDTAASVTAGAGESRTAQLRIAHGNGAYRHLEVVANNLLDNPAVNGIVLNAKDVTDQVEAAAELEERTFHDDLTGLPNRALLIERMQDALRRARERRLLVGILFLDLDRFKVVNESLGHTAGDELLSEVAARIEDVIRPGDTVARLGGDEFAVVIGDMLRRGDAVVAARRLRKALTQPIRVGDDTTVITTSIGIAIAEGNEDPADLLRDADTALYRAKEKGRDVAVVFDDHLRDKAVRRLDLEKKLRRAIESDDLLVHYQPVLNVQTGRLAGAEALVRIRNADGSIIMPGEFIDVAEDSGLIAQLGHQVLVKAIRQTAEWTHLHVPGQEPLSIAVNVSARQLTDANYPDQLASELQSAGLAPTQLSLELTESALIDGNPVTERSLLKLRDLGVRIGLDDFGTGFSSLAYLKRFPISFLKVDKSFVGGLGTDENDSAIVRGTIALAHGLNLRVVAEGVETEQQLQLLGELDCDLVQGYLFSKAASPEQFRSFLGMRWDPAVAVRSAH
jgi:diguanylate cyclase (GGDEF)-like protein/PAS domain S-box-containing protein